jgi:hypothetical protein
VAAELAPHGLSIGVGTDPEMASMGDFGVHGTDNLRTPG